MTNTNIQIHVACTQNWEVPVSYQWCHTKTRERVRENSVTVSGKVLILNPLVIERSWVRIPAEAAGEFSSSWSTFCADSYFGIRSTPCCLLYTSDAADELLRVDLKIGGIGDSSVARPPDSWSKCCRFESLQKRRENFLLQCELSVPTLISVSVPPPCYRSST